MDHHIKFGYQLTSIFVLISVYLFCYDYFFQPTAFISLVIFFLCIFKSSKLKFIEKFWLKIGIFISKIVNPIIMVFIFFGLFTPIAIFFKLIGRDVLSLKKEKNEKSYWTSRNDITVPENFKDQF